MDLDEPMEESHPPVSRQEQPQPSLVRTAIVMSEISEKDYETQYWPKLVDSLTKMLTMRPEDYAPISYEQIYSLVYKCVCQQHSERMYSDLVALITQHLEQVSAELQVHVGNTDAYLEKFNSAFTQYTQALCAIVPVFNYMNRFYVTTKLNSDLKEELAKLFATHVSDRHIAVLLSYLEEVQSNPFWVPPATLSNIVRGLYTLKPEYTSQKPELFAKYIPNILPPTNVSDLGQYAEEARQMQLRLLEEHGVPRGDQSRKRSADEFTPRLTKPSF